jgi:predicted NodU family carbamoyl transferase
MALAPGVPIRKQHGYVLGFNTYDHDVSACLLRDGAIAFAIAKERITREKHASGFYNEVIDYCLDAEGITLDDVDLIVRNCYILPVDRRAARRDSQRRRRHGDGERTAGVNQPPDVFRRG